MVFITRAEPSAIHPLEAYVAKGSDTPDVPLGAADVLVAEEVIAADDEAPADVLVTDEVIPDDDAAAEELAGREVVLPTAGMAEDEIEALRLAVLDDETAEVGFVTFGTDAARRVALYTLSVFALPQISPERPLQDEAQ